MFQATVSVSLWNRKQKINTVHQRYLLEPYLIHFLVGRPWNNRITASTWEIFTFFMHFSSFQLISVETGSFIVIVWISKQNFITLSVSFYLPFDKINARSVEFFFVFVAQPNSRRKTNCWEKLFSNKKPFVIQTFFPSWSFLLPFGSQKCKKK